MAVDAFVADHEERFVLFPADEGAILFEGGQERLHLQGDPLPQLRAVGLEHHPARARSTLVTMKSASRRADRYFQSDEPLLSPRRACAR